VGYTFDERMAVLGPHVHDGVPLVQAASAAGVPLRTAQRWLTAYLTQGAIGAASIRSSGQGPAPLAGCCSKVIEGGQQVEPQPGRKPEHRQRLALGVSRPTVSLDTPTPPASPIDRHDQCGASARVRARVPQPETLRRVTPIPGGTRRPPSGRLLFCGW
jgi:hypothetical protein